MRRIDSLVSSSLYTIREAYSRFRKPAIMWSGGKDSTVLLSLVRESFLGEVPMPVLHSDTGCQFPEVIEFRDKMVKEWELELIVSECNERGYQDFKSKEECCSTLKVAALMNTIQVEGIDALLVGIRGDEHGVRAKEKVFSPRGSDMKWSGTSQPSEPWSYYSTGEHTRVHPLLYWSEVDVWRYIMDWNLTVLPLYFSSEGKRYRSVGCIPCTAPVLSAATTIPEVIHEIIESQTSERAGRAQDKERLHMMERLRREGYF